MCLNSNSHYKSAIIFFTSYISHEQKRIYIILDLGVIQDDRNRANSIDGEATNRESRNMSMVS